MGKQLKESPVTLKKRTVITKFFSQNEQNEQFVVVQKIVSVYLFMFQCICLCFSFAFRANSLVNKIAAVNMFQRIRDQFIQEWHSTVHESSKCLNYRIFKTTFDFKQYFINLPFDLMIAFCKFRCMNHNNRKFLTQTEVLEFVLYVDLTLINLVMNSTIC